jgi:hypothetical protein
MNRLSSALVSTVAQGAPRDGEIHSIGADATAIDWNGYVDPADVADDEARPPPTRCVRTQARSGDERRPHILYVA